jgi:hypothetical protein
VVGKHEVTRRSVGGGGMRLKYFEEGPAVVAKLRDRVSQSVDAEFRFKKRLVARENLDEFAPPDVADVDEDALDLMPRLLVVSEEKMEDVGETVAG